MNYCDYLLEELNEVKGELGFDKITIKVVPERSFKLPKDQNILLFVVKNLTGTYNLSVKNQPIQIVAYSELNTFSIVQQILEGFVLTHKNGSLKSVFYEGTTLVKQDYNTPVALRAILPTDIGFKASFYCYGEYNECAELADIQNLKWKKSNLPSPDGTYEKVDYININVPYAAVVNTTKVSGEEISTSMKQEASLSIQMTLMNNTSDFVKQINKVMLGKLSGNTAFRFKFTLNGEDFEGDFILTDSGFTGDRVNAPGLSVTFSR